MSIDADNNGIISDDEYKYLVVDQSYGVSTSTYSGTYLGTIIDDTYSSNTSQQLIANDSEADLEALISYYLGMPYDIVVYKKAEENNNFVDNVGVVTLSVYFNDPATTGTWIITPDSYALDFYAVKGSNEYALYALYPDSLSTGSWTTAHLTNSGAAVGLSHFSGSVVNTPVPEPGTVLLFGTGLAGLAAVGRRRKN